MAKSKIIAKSEMEAHSANRLREFRKRAGYKSAKQFAELIGVNVRVYQSYESGEIKMSIGAAWLFADLLGCTIDELVGRKRD